MDDIVRKKRNKFILIILIIFALIVILFTMFGVVDYFRAKSGKKPIFIYHTASNTNIDVLMEGSEDTALPSKTNSIYYGIGYNVSICDNESGNYKFQLGDKKKEPCVTSLTCTENEADNFKTTHTFDFFEGKLYLLTTSLLRPVDMSDDEDTLKKGIAEIDDIYGVSASINKINETTYEIFLACNIFNMTVDDIEKGCMISYYELKEIPDLTRTEIIDYYNKAMICE